MMDDFGNDINEVASYTAFAPFARHLLSDQPEVQMDSDEYQYWMEAK